MCYLFVFSVCPLFVCMFPFCSLCLLWSIPRFISVSAGIAQINASLDSGSDQTTMEALENADVGLRGVTRECQSSYHTRLKEVKQNKGKQGRYIFYVFSFPFGLYRPSFSVSLQMNFVPKTDPSRRGAIIMVMKRGDALRKKLRPLQFTSDRCKIGHNCSKGYSSTIDGVKFLIFAICSKFSSNFKLYCTYYCTVEEHMR